MSLINLLKKNIFPISNIILGIILVLSFFKVVKPIKDISFYNKYKFFMLIAGLFLIAYGIICL